MRKFKVNKLITLKLEDSKTNIYINKALFQQCKMLLLHIPVDDIKDFDNVDSIDKEEERLVRSKVRSDVEIHPEDEFWGHCSNLQAWYENDYDSLLLHRNLAFPLLEKLTQLGDPIAKKVFRKEIIKRFKSGVPSVIQFLSAEGYLDYLHLEEIKELVEDSSEDKIDLALKSHLEDGVFNHELMIYIIDAFGGMRPFWETLQRIEKTEPSFNINNLPSRVHDWLAEGFNE